MNKKRTISIGDVHGMRAELEQLLENVQYDPASDQLVLLGDLVDRGPEPVQVVALVKALADSAAAGMVKLILGNHECCARDRDA
jgi:predicted MPP superfamily phosphohydrolase